VGMEVSYFREQYYITPYKNVQNIAFVNATHLYLKFRKFQGGLACFYQT
jgi:hypothetical protein